MELGKASWRTFEQGITTEWLLANGIGGFAASTVIGANTRRYHGLLVASLNPPVSRHLILSKIDESVELQGRTYELYTYRTPDSTGKGHMHLQRFIYDAFPVFVYSVEDAVIEKKIAMVYGKNTVAVVYHIINGSTKMRLKLTPLVNFRDYHHNSGIESLEFSRRQNGRELILEHAHINTVIRLFCGEGAFEPASDGFFRNMYYEVERERGLYPIEDHYIPGSFVLDAAPHEEKTVTFIATVENEISCTDGEKLLRQEEKRVEELICRAGFTDPLLKSLSAAADKFIVYRKSTGSRTILAGYPWFTDWGRDSMISLTGLTLATKRYGDAREILYTFSRYVWHGLIPNMLPDQDQKPAYNSVDAALWYVEAVWKYAAYTEDYKFIKEHIYPTLREIVSWYANGTEYDIKMCSDGLITAGNENTQLTWMDAKVGGIAVTPRYGKAVEINALWYNALAVMAAFSERFGDGSMDYAGIAGKVKQSFETVFWNEGEQCLYDVVSGSAADGDVRPNQIMAVSLSHPVLEGIKAKMVVEKVYRELYTAYGLRSLSPFNRAFKGSYTGEQYIRDQAYHQGTVWVWPLGQFITAFLRVNGYTETARETALRFINPFRDHIREAGLGAISEIFDGNEPLHPRGCFAQAWSVAEILRACVEDLNLK